MKLPYDGALDDGVKTWINGNSIWTSGSLNERDKELTDKIMTLLAEETVSLGKAMAVLDAARTAMLKGTLKAALSSFSSDAWGI